MEITPKINITDRLHSAESAAVLLGVRPSTIRWWWSIGRLPRLKVGRLSRVRESAVLALIEHDYTSEPKTRGGHNARV